MTGLALTIIILSALCHASWNLLAKTGRNKLVFTWWLLMASVVLYFPMFLYFRPPTPFTPAVWSLVAATSLTHFLYFWFLSRAYELGDLSYVYPLARGSGPAMTPALAVLLIDERLSPAGVLGIVLVVAGIFVIHLPSFSLKGLTGQFRNFRGDGSQWAILTGVTIAVYSLVDKVAVGLIDPPVYIYLMFCGAFFLLTPYVLLNTEAGALKVEWREHWKSVCLGGFLVVFAYLLVLFAMRMAKVSYVVSVRELSIVFSVLFGIVGLKEKGGLPKIMGAAAIALGVVLIGLAR